MSAVRRPLFLAVTQALLLGGVITAQANRLGDPIQVGPDFVVNATDDNGDGFCEEGVGTCTLRDAVEAANANPDASIITFDPTVFASQTTITLSQSDMVIDQSITIAGPGADQLTIDAADQSRHFHFADITDPNRELTTTNTVSGMTLINGNGNAGTPDPGERGGAIRTVAPLTVDQMHIRNNRTGGGAAVWSRFADVAVSNSTLSNNAARFRGGAIYARDNELVIENTTITNNTSDASSQGGSAIEINRSVLTLSDSTVSNNESLRLDGASIVVSNANAQTVVRIERSIVSAANNQVDLEGPGSFELNYALVSDPGTVNITGNKASLTNISPLLGDLADNGGPMPTQALLFNSPAIDAGGAGCGSVDQRGQPRPFDGDGDLTARCDIGAVEMQVINADDPRLFSDGFELSL